MQSWGFRKICISFFLADAKALVIQFTSAFASALLSFLVSVVSVVHNVYQHIEAEVCQA